MFKNKYELFTQWHTTLRLTMIVCFLLFSIVPINVPMPISLSGYINIMVSELIAPILALIIYSGLFTFNETKQAKEKILIALYFFLVFWLLILTGLRFLTHAELLQSWLVMRSTSMLVITYLSFRYKKWLSHYALSALAIFNIIINFMQLPNWNNIRMSPFMGNSFVFVSITTILIPVNIFLIGRIIQTKKTVWTLGLLIITISNLILSSIFAVFSGSRIVIFFLALSSLTIIIFLLINKLKKVFMFFLISQIFSIFFLALIWLCNPFDAAMGIYRVVSAPSNIESTKESSIMRSHIEKENSNKIRSKLWKDSISSFLDNPLIGNGKVYFATENNYNVKKQSAHNFILEHLNAYGLIGGLIYFGCLICMITNFNLENKKLSMNKASFLAYFISIIAFSFSFFQPTALIIPFVIVFAMSLAGLQAASMEFQHG